MTVARNMLISPLKRDSSCSCLDVSTARDHNIVLAHAICSQMRYQTQRKPKRATRLSLTREVGELQTSERLSSQECFPHVAQIQRETGSQQNKTLSKQGQKTLSE